MDVIPIETHRNGKPVTSGRVVRVPTRRTVADEKKEEIGIDAREIIIIDCDGDDIPMKIYGDGRPVTPGREKVPGDPRRPKERRGERRKELDLKVIPWKDYNRN